MGKVDQIVAPIMRTELPTVSLSPQHPKYLWYLVPALAYLAFQGKIDDLHITTIISLLVPAVVIDLTCRVFGVAIRVTDRYRFNILLFVSTCSHARTNKTRGKILGCHAIVK